MNDYDPNSIDAVLARTQTLLERVEKRLDEGDEKFAEHEDRIGALENWRYYVIGISVVGVVVFKLVTDWLMKTL